MKTKIFLTFFPLFFLLVFANGVGNSQQKEVNGYLFEFGMEPNYVIEKQKIPMSISVHEKQTGKAVETEKFWIRISEGEKIFFSSTDLKTKTIGPIIFLYAFPEEGLYTIDFGFNDKQGKQVSAQFEVSVLASITGEENLLQLIITSILLLFLGFFIGFIAKSVKK